MPSPFPGMVMNTMYDIFSYDAEIDYNAPLDTPLPADDSAWARKEIDRWR